MDLQSIINAQKYSSNMDINEYIKSLDKLSLLLDGSALASVSSFKFMLLQDKNFFKDIEFLKAKKINGFDKFKIKSSYKLYNIYNYGVDLQRYILAKQISLLNLAKQDKNSIKYINNIFSLAQLYSSEDWEKHFLATIISSTLYDSTRRSGNKTLTLETFSKNVVFFEGIEKLYLSDNKKFDNIYKDFISIPIKNSYIYIIKNNIKDNNILNTASQQNNFKDLIEASYPYLFLNFTSFFNQDLEKEYFQKINKEKFEKVKKEYEKTKSKQLLVELSILSKKII